MSEYLLLVITGCLVLTGLCLLPVFLLVRSVVCMIRYLEESGLPGFDEQFRQLQDCLSRSDYPAAGPAHAHLKKALAYFNQATLQFSRGHYFGARDLLDNGLFELKLGENHLFVYTIKPEQYKKFCNL